ncbi:MAG: YkgJ family cysteine cluster protein [Nitrosopumilaceae archaeon]
MTSFAKLCGSCKHQGCCTNSSTPLVFSNDFNALKSIGKSGTEYLQEVTIKGKKVSALKKKNNSNICVFWDEDKKMCSVYEKRPFDCRAYPFDIYLIDGKYHWIVYSCNPESNWQWSEDYLQELEKDMELNGVFNDIETFANNTELILPQELQKTSFTILREVRIPESEF